jgi:hypothetical protein
MPISDEITQSDLMKRRTRAVPRTKTATFHLSAAASSRPVRPALHDRGSSSKVKTPGLCQGHRICGAGKGKGRDGTLLPEPVAGSTQRESFGFTDASPRDGVCVGFREGWGKGGEWWMATLVSGWTKGKFRW